MHIVLKELFTGIQQTLSERFWVKNCKNKTSLLNHMKTTRR
ncbi:hypothetical protein MtrunA17_Chr8g0345111 [Medicago truncatula]|uniref:Uncharacterized protein n=1 Tax=Medicago truncatula TaxID=3880 RepID=A0A396GEE3_MEDTR|nr:hypothetical protein MtrunA17_Chr8g0345111 [Medicago truncatula]